MDHPDIAYLDRYAQACCSPFGALSSGAGGIGGVARQRRDAQTQQSIASQTEAQKQQAMQKYETAYGACLTGRGYAVQ